MTAPLQASSSTLGKQPNASSGASMRRRGSQHGRTSRSTKYGDKINSNELRELVIASQLVPTGHSTKNPAANSDLDSVSTAAPSSEHSPDLTCMESDLKAWPTLPLVEDGWNFCGEASDINDIWEDLPEPALAIEGTEQSTHEDVVQSASHPEAPTTTSWWLIPGFGLTESTLTLASGQDVPSKLTFARLLRNQKGGHLPPPYGIVAPTRRKSAAQPLNKTMAVAQDPIVLDEMDVQTSCRWHGWTKEHKGTWSAKQCRKVASRKWQRCEQRRQSCNGLEEGDEKA